MGVGPSRVDSTSIFTVATLGWIDETRKLIESGADLNVKDEEGWTPLMDAVLYGQEDVLKVLIEAGADINIKNNDGEDALQLAGKYGDWKIMEILFKTQKLTNKQELDSLNMMFGDLKSAAGVKALNEFLADASPPKSDTPHVLRWYNNIKSIAAGMKKTKTSVLFDVKPWDERDMEAMKTACKSIEMDGLVWGATKLVPVDYGINKLQIMCTVEDEKVSIEELMEKIWALDTVQTVKTDLEKIVS